MEVKTELPDPTSLPRLKRKASDASSVEPMDVDQSHMDVDDTGGATKGELLRRLMEREQHIKDLRSDFGAAESELTKSLHMRIEELEESNDDNLNKISALDDNCTRAHNRIRFLEQQLSQKDATTRLTATRFGNLQTKCNEKEKEVAKISERYERLALQGLPMSPLHQNQKRTTRRTWGEEHRDSQVPIRHRMHARRHSRTTIADHREEWPTTRDESAL